MFSSDFGTLQSTLFGSSTQFNAKLCEPWQVPFALKEPLERELSQLEDLEILHKVKHSEWMPPVLVVPKGDGCLQNVVTTNRP